MTSRALGELQRSQLPGGEIMLGVPVRREWRWYGSAARAAFRTFAFIKLRPGVDGTQVNLTLRSQHFVAGFVTAWLALVALFTATIVAIIVTASAQPYGLAIAFFLLGLGILFIPLGRFLARSDRTALVGFVSMVVSVR